MDEPRARNKKSRAEIEAWVLGSGTASLAAAVYLVQRAKLQPHNVHVLDSHISMGAVLHHNGDAIHGYDQFAQCLPVPVGSPLKELLASIPSGKAPGDTVLDDIRKEEARRIPKDRQDRTKFLVQKANSRDHLLLRGLGLGIRNRIRLALLMLQRENRLGRKRIQDLMPKSFFQSGFWATWTAQFGFQTWHSAVEFRRALRQYLHEIHSLSILSCLDITGYYQYESIFLPIYLYLRNLGVDFHFDTKVTNIDIAVEDGSQRISRLNLLENGFQITKDINADDLVILMLGSTVSGSSIGTDDYPPPIRPIEPNEEYDENWTLWLELGTHDHTFGNPYNFCTRLHESTLASFTITTGDPSLWDFLASIASHAEAGTFIILPDSPWELSLCIPTQPVFSQQPTDIHVVWGFALFPRRNGQYVSKTMEECSGVEIITELLGHLKYPSPIHHTMTIPRLMPRMSSMLLVRSMNDRPEVIPQRTSNLGLVGQFVEIPQYSCVDISYGIRTAEVAISRLTGSPLPIDKHEHRGSMIGNVLRILFGK